MLAFIVLLLLMAVYWLYLSHGDPPGESFNYVITRAEADRTGSHANCGKGEVNARTWTSV